VIWFRRVCVGALLAYVLFHLTMTHLPKAPAVFDGTSDKSLHFFSYFVVGVLGYTAARAVYLGRRQLGLIVIFFGSLFAVVDEISQPMFSRHAEFADWCSDVLGLCAAVLTCAIVRRLFKLIARSGSLSVSNELA